MERLTEKVNDYWKTNDKAHIYYLDKNESVFVGNAIDRLAEFEDFMEEIGFDSLNDLKKTLGKQFEIKQNPRHLGREINGVYFTNEQCYILSQFIEFNTSYLKKYKDTQQENQTIEEDRDNALNQRAELEQENQALKSRWQKLKKLLEEDMEHNSKEYDDSFCSAFQHYSATENWVLDRMEELEKE